ncbi:uncharacterized conserved membrane protein DUF2721 [Synechococcus sp. SYN20]|uniref:DUF2721 domain-containing protein n=1 Tax=Synechococcus sp. SYN20 TaxID=1050714 RepID=UPI0016441E71|nr:DUF2721 domain-containing protein [Synechococcus sp. SYN20]QNJ25454.1 uncharacterized conserved membrane protein DUF2721 [Synechococcus sp. SYN20]
MDFSTLHPESLSKAIQLSVSPVFLLAGIGALLNVLSARLARIADHSRRLSESDARRDDFERRHCKRRMQHILRAIWLLTCATLLLSIVVSAMFMSVITQVNLTAIVAPLFITTMGMLMMASISFLLEVRLASEFVQRKF